MTTSLNRLPSPSAATFDQCGLPLTATVDAAAAYAKGVTALLSGQLAASRANFTSALNRDSSFALAHAAAAIVCPGSAEHVRCRLHTARWCATRGTRRERQHVEILAAVLRGDVDRAVALAVEHLGEFPEDVLVLHVVSEATKGANGPSRSAEFLPTIVAVLRSAARSDIEE